MCKRKADLTYKAWSKGETNNFHSNIHSSNPPQDAKGTALLPCHFLLHSLQAPQVILAHPQFLHQALYSLACLSLPTVTLPRMLLYSVLPGKNQLCHQSSVQISLLLINLLQIPSSLAQCLVLQMMPAVLSPNYLTERCSDLYCVCPFCQSEGNWPNTSHLKGKS